MFSLSVAESRRDRSESARSRCRHYQTMVALSPAVKIRTQDMLNPQERKFLEAAEMGDKPTLESCLEKKNTLPLNINAVDSMGRTAIEIAVDNENNEIVELLLQQPDIRIGNALLCAIREGVYKTVEMLVNHSSITKTMLGEGWADYIESCETTSAEYSSDISPVILAAHLNQFEILQMLLSKDATIEKPHKHSCQCSVCDRERLDDSLHHSLKRINTYKALASPAWMSLTSPDPIFSAFKLSWELKKLSKIEHEFMDRYMQLSEQCTQYACDLLEQCRNTEEVIGILNKDQSSSSQSEDVWSSKLSLCRLKLAIKYGQKKFVAHPHCQQLLTSIWYEGFPGWKRRGSMWNNVICLLLIVLWPVLAICYILVPKSRIGRIVRSPFMKFLYYAISFGCFLALLTLATFESYRYEKGELRGGGENRASDRGPQPTVIETLVMVWVFVLLTPFQQRKKRCNLFFVGMLWSEVKQLWEEGFKRYIRQWWNWLDFIMMCLYLSTISVRASAYYIYSYTDDINIKRYATRTIWNPYEPVLVAEALFAVGNIFSFARINYLFQTNPYLGPLQISLGSMLVDVAKFCFIFVLIISSFSIGLAQLYWYYPPYKKTTSNNCPQEQNTFSSIASSYITLLWSLFSITKVEDTDVDEDHSLTESVGSGMFLTYHMTAIIVLLNMLIAMMSHSFQQINDAADLEWKFHRTKLWMAYFDEGSSLPPPFNLIITPKSFYYFILFILNTIRWFFGKYNYKHSMKRGTIRRPGYNRKTKELSYVDGPDYEPQSLTYADIIRRLVARFIHQTKKGIKTDAVTEDDLLEIKQEIRSLRYELRDDRRKDTVRSSSHIDAVKRAIIRRMSSSVFSAPRKLSRKKESVPECDENYDSYDSETDSRYTTVNLHKRTTISSLNYSFYKLILQ
uniref:ANK_REP_REGION domain-containing protein n=1 Tax=Syphacia muris TaxID=451379 RepID=A0A0N5APW5_9BILA